MYYVSYIGDDGRLQISQKGFATLDNALNHAARLEPSRKAKVLEEFNSQRVVFKPKPKPEPVWRELATPAEPIPPNGIEHLGELLRAKVEAKRYWWE